MWVTRSCQRARRSTQSIGCDSFDRVRSLQPDSLRRGPLLERSEGLAIGCAFANGVGPSAWSCPSSASATQCGSPGLASEADDRLIRSDALMQPDSLRRGPDPEGRSKGLAIGGGFARRVGPSAWSRPVECLRHPRPHVGHPVLPVRPTIDSFDRMPSSSLTLFDEAPFSGWSKGLGARARARGRLVLLESTSLVSAPSATPCGSPGFASEPDDRLIRSDARKGVSTKPRSPVPRGARAWGDRARCATGGGI
jgi:hypothetical protein